MIHIQEILFVGIVKLFILENLVINAVEFFIKMTENEDLFCDLIKIFKGRIRIKTEIGSWQSKKRKAALSENDWAQQLAEELHKPIKRKFKTRKVIL